MFLFVVAVSFAVVLVVVVGGGGGGGVVVVWLFDCCLLPACLVMKRFIVYLLGLLVCF